MRHKKAHALTPRERRVEEWFEWPMVTVTLILLVLLVIPLAFPLSPVWRDTLAILNLVVWMTFYVELFVKFYVSSSWRRTFKRNWFLCVIAISPLFLSFRLIRLSRLVSLVRLLRLQSVVRQLNETVKRIIYNIEYILLTLVLFTLISAFVVWQIEVRFDGSIASLPEALWWAVVTVTTIGYGDIVPASAEGKIAGAVVGLFGATLFMVLLARITAVFVKVKQ